MQGEPAREAHLEQPVHLVVVPHTHWDREWYQPFQEFRTRLVRLVDRLLDILDRDAAFAHFHLDGQTIVLEDYLEIRPHERARLRRLIAAGRIAIGPWYVLPDEFLVSGESLIRNLQIGHHLAAQFGKPTQVGYLPDQFGHTAQMPQILAGFGIDCAVVWRGVGADVTRTVFSWEGLDGSRAFTVYLACDGYSNGRSLPNEAVGLRERLAGIVAEQAEYRAIPSVLVMNGTDHEEPQPALPGLLAAARKEMDGLSYEIAPLTRFITRARAECDGLQTHHGELRSCLRSHLTPGVTSVRVRQKQRDFANVGRLERYAEPLATWADSLTKGETPRLTDFTDWAWKTTVQNHPHDSIAGCSVDQVHRDMEYRFDQVELLTQQITRQALTVLTEQLDTSQVSPDSAFVVYNPNGGGAAVVHSEIYLDETTGLGLEDHDGRRLPVHIDACESEVLFAAEITPAEARPHVLALQGREFLGHVINDIRIRRDGERLFVMLTIDRVARGRLDVQALRARWLAQLDDPALKTVAVRAQTGVPARVTFVAPQLTGHGFTVFALRRTVESAVSTESAIAAGNGGIENEYFRVSVNDDATVSITDKQSGMRLPRCNWFVDEADRGDEYNFDPLADGQPVAAPVAAPSTRIDADGVVATLTIGQVYELPRALNPDRETRAAERVRVPIVTTMRLHAGVRRVDFETLIDNQACDHRLRVHFHTPLAVRSAFMEQAFGVVERELDLEAGDDNVERPVATGPQKTFSCIQDGVSGVAVFNRGIPEVEARRVEGGTEIALTLIRAVGALSRGDLRWRHGHAGPGLETPDAQTQGAHRFEYALTTFGGDWQAAALAAQAHGFAYPPLLTLVDAHSGPLPANATRFQCANPNIILSAQAPSKRHDACVLRCYNTTTLNQRASIRIPAAERVRRVDFLEQPRSGGVRRLRDGTVRVDLQPFEIVNLQVRTASISTAA